MGFFKDVDEGKVSNDGELNTDDVLESLDDITIDDAFASMEDIMTPEEALASLDSEYVKEMESAAAELSELDKASEEEPELTLEDVMADFPDFIGDTAVTDESAEEVSEEESFADDVEEAFVENAGDTVEEETDLSVEEVMAGLPDMVIPEDMDSPAEEDMGEETVQNNMEDTDMSHETTVISKGTTIRGGISSDCSLDVMGVITGDVECQGKLSIFGTVSGNTSAAEIFVETEHRLNGDLISTGNVNINEKSVVIGTIQASSAVIAGAVKGDIDVDGPVVIDSTAVIYGNITAKSLQLNTGAVIQGILNIGTKDIDVNSIFGE